MSTVTPEPDDRERVAAISAAERGWAVFPCRPGDKRPAVDRWGERACSDPERVARHWPPRCNVGIACGPSGLVVVDLDTPAHGGVLPTEWAAEPGIVDGVDVLATLAERAGQPWPWTYTVRTPSGGQHLYFTAPARAVIRNSAGRAGPMVDVRAAGGYVVGAASVVGGREYELIDGSDPVALPAWLVALLRPTVTGPALPSPRSCGELYPRLRGVVEAVLRSRPGTRNERLFWAACRTGEMVAAGQLDRATAERVLIQAAVDAGLPGAEARNTVASGLGAA